MSKSVIDIEKELDDKIPRDVVSLRDGGGGRKLSYLEGWYVIDRLNKVFGPLNWAKEILDVRLLEGSKPAYLVKVRLTVKNGHEIYTVKEGYGYGSDKGPNNPHELAIKEAVTDALKVAAKDLGMSMGLALYDKSQENVDDTKEESAVANAKPITPKPTVAAQGDLQTLSDAIKSYFKVAEAQKRLSKENFRNAFLGEHGAAKVDELTKEQMELVLIKLKDLTK